MDAHAKPPIFQYIWWPLFSVIAFLGLQEANLLIMLSCTLVLMVYSWWLTFLLWREGYFKNLSNEVGPTRDAYHQAENIEE